MLIDGFIVSVAALAAVRLNPSCQPFLLPSHQSAEQGHRLVLRALNVQPLISLDLRLGEGSGAAIALPLVRSPAPPQWHGDLCAGQCAGSAA